MAENTTPEKGPTTPSAAEAKASLNEVASKLDRLERTTGRSGAVPNTPKHRLLAVDEIQKLHPDKRLRWGTLTNPDKMTDRINSGYERLPLDQGGKQVGNMVLLAISREQYERNVASILEENKRRMVQHNREVERVAVEVAKYLRDNHGMRINEEDIIVRG